MFIINMDNVLTLSESSDMEMIICIKISYRDSQRDISNNQQN